MSDRREPTLADVLDAVLGLGRKQEEFGLKLEGLSRRQDEFGVKLEHLSRRQDEFGLKLEDLGRRQDEFGVKLEALGRWQDGLRVNLMDRMDRLQNAMAEQRNEVGVFLELLSTNQRIAERGLSEARTSLDPHSRTSAALTTMQYQIRQLRDDLNQLRATR